MKGREKDCIILIDFHERYFQYYETRWGSRPDVPNVIYVAATRSRKQLVVVADAKATLRTVDLGVLDGDVEYVGSGRPSAYKFKHPQEEDKHIGVLDLLRHTDTATERTMLSFLTKIGESSVDAPTAEVASAVTFGNYAEDVSSFYGIVIPRIAEFHLTDRTMFGENVSNPNIVDSHKLIENPWDMTQSAFDAFPKTFWETVSAAYATDCGDRTWVEWFSIAVAEEAVINGRYHVARQILHYDWIDETFTNQCVGCVRETLGTTLGTFEVSLPAASLPRGAKQIIVHGIADYVEEPAADVAEHDAPLWEFKCCSDVTDAHLLQLGCYLALAGRTTGKLYAIKSGAIATIRLELKNAAAFLSSAMAKYAELPTSDIRMDIERFRAGLKSLAEEDDRSAAAQDYDDRPDTSSEFSLDDM